ncbi:hypothetical protein FANTH_9325 [Fusarium anthophilum]|uniref:Mid2 domain-containing protein n=2 Tax=Fusarium fujikuroi species complex TaxID=171627 RepID=A0A8H5JGZ8_9HYPO|nr:hypothetical protein FANTH_9325 [Fusarium anthophilum]KAF5555184.1 hypothetical protein FMEXI_1590 [Fusarium mexicanum]
MTPALPMARLPPFLVISGVLNLATGHVLPQATKTVDFYELNVLPYPLAATPAPDDSLLLRRQFNTVCGYLGGDPGLPATCSAGSHCVVDVDHGAVGCCPDGGSCTSGVFTGCVDADSGPQTEVNPYVFTCRGSNSCYRNSYEGGFFQFGCGSTSGLATKVVATASGKSAIDLTSINVPLTQPKPPQVQQQKSETSTASETESDTSTETTASETADPSSTESGDSDAPDTDGKDNGSKNTGAIIGGTISGVAALAALIVLGIWLWKRKKGNTRQGPGVKHQVQHIGPPLDNNHNFAPVPPMHETDKMAPPPPVPVRNQQRTMNSAAGHEEPYSEPWDPSSNYGYGNSAGAVGGSSHMEHDEVPLTRDDDFDHSYNSGLGRISEEHPRPGTAISTPGQMSQVYPGPRGGGGGPLWQQNRGPGWF